MVKFLSQAAPSLKNHTVTCYLGNQNKTMHKLKFKKGSIVSVFYEAICSINWIDETTKIKYSFEPYLTPQNETKHKVTAIKDGGIAPIISGFELRFEGDLLFMDAFSNSYKIAALNTTTYPCEFEIESSFSAKTVQMKSYLK